MMRRWHDRGKLAWWNLLVLVPFIGGVWVLMELGFLSGQPHSNDCGASTDVKSRDVQMALKRIRE